MSRTALAVLIGLCAAVVLSYLDRMAITWPAMTAQLQLGWSNSQKLLWTLAIAAGYVALMVAAGGFTNRLGGLKALQLALGWWSLCAIVTPLAAVASLPLLVATRIALGVGVAFVFPAAFNLIARRISPSHWSRAVALVASMVSLSAALAPPLTRRLVRDHGWEAPFYWFGGAGLIAAVAWFALSRATRSPEQAERGHAIPWALLLRTPGVWGIVAGHAAYAWCIAAVFAPSPSQRLLTGRALAVGAPLLSHFIMANTAGWVADRLLNAGRDVTAVRKLMQAAGLGVGGLFLLITPFAASPPTAVLVLCGASGALALTLAGFAPNALDISPTYADVIYALGSPAAALPALGAAGLALAEQAPRNGGPQFAAAAVALLGALIYFRIGSGVRRTD